MIIVARLPFTTDIVAFGARVSASVMVIFRVLAEVGLFLLKLVTIVFSSGCAVIELERDRSDREFMLMPSVSVLEIILHVHCAPWFLTEDDLWPCRRRLSDSRCIAGNRAEGKFEDEELEIGPGEDAKRV